MAAAQSVQLAAQHMCTNPAASVSAPTAVTPLLPARSSANAGSALRPAAVAGIPATAMGVAAGSIAVGAPADLILFSARRFDELIARPQSDRIVIRGGRRIDATPPDFAELDRTE